MNIKRVLIAILLATGLLLISCTKTPEMEEKPIKIGWCLWPGWYPVAIAQELKIFTKNGVKIEPVLYNDYTQIFSDLASGKLDGGFCGLYEILKANIPGVRVVLVTDYSDGAEGLVVTPNIKTAKDLSGKRIGLQGSLSGGEYAITTYMRKYGLPPKGITFMDVAPEVVLEQMPNNIQGGWTWEPFLSRAKDKGYKLLFSTADMPGMIPDVAVFRGNIIKDRPLDVKKFINSWYEAIEYWKIKPDQANAAIAKVTGVKREDISLQGCRLLTRQGNVNAFKKGGDFNSLYYTAEKQVLFFISIGDAALAPNLDTMLDSSFLR